MTIQTYAQLSTAVTNWLHRSDMSSIVGDLISLGEARINSTMRVRAMETSLSVAISSGVAAVPSDYVELKHAYLTTTPYQTLERKTAEWIYRTYPTRSSSGKPKFIAREGSNFIFGPYADSSYTINGIYYARPVALSSATNALFTSYPSLYLFAALAEAAPFLKDDKRTPLWEAKFTSLAEMVQLEDKVEQRSGSPLMVVAG